jgi:rod shape-determining protein MreB
MGIRLIQRIEALFVSDLAIDFGTTNTVMFVKDQGIVVDEPSIAALDQRTGRYVAFGREAKEMVGRTPEGIVTIRPIQDGVIANFRVAECLLRHFIGKAIGPTRYRRRRIIVGIPSVITAVEKRAVFDSVLRASGSKVHLVDQAMAAAIGAGLPVIEPKGSMVVDVGGGTTNIAIISMSGLVHTQTLRAAGNAMDAAISDYVRHKYQLLIGEHSAEELKMIIGSEAAPTRSSGISVTGRARIGGLPATAIFSDSDFATAIDEPLNAIAAGVRATLEKVTPEISSDIAGQGITLTGGGALLREVGRRIERETNISTHIAENPLRSVVMGAGALLGQRQLLDQVTVDC